MMLQAQAAGAVGPAWQMAGIPSVPPTPRSPMYMHRKSSTIGRHLKKTSWRSLSTKPPLAVTLPGTGYATLPPYSATVAPLLQ